jgi:hypothetical protein
MGHAMAAGLLHSTHCPTQAVMMRECCVAAELVCLLRVAVHRMQRASLATEQLIFLPAS